MARIVSDQGPGCAALLRTFGIHHGPGSCCACAFTALGRARCWQATRHHCRHAAWRPGGCMESAVCVHRSNKGGLSPAVGWRTTRRTTNCSIAQAAQPAFFAARSTSNNAAPELYVCRLLPTAERGAESVQAAPNPTSSPFGLRHLDVLALQYSNSAQRIAHVE